MMNVIILLSLLGYCLGLRRFALRQIEASLFIVVSAYVVILYFSSLIGVLKPVSWIVLIFGWLFLIAAPYYLRQGKQSLFKEYFTPGFVLSLFVILIFCLIAQHLLLSGEDELTHWGPHAKLIYYFHGLIPASIVTIHKDYPPGGALFYYPFFLFRGYSEGSAYFAQSLLNLAPLMMLTKNISWKHWPRALFILFIAIMGLYWLGASLGPYTSLYMDTSVGIYWGSLAIFSQYYVKKPSDLLWLMLPAIALMLFKLKLMPLLVLALTVIFIQQLILNNKNFSKPSVFFRLCFYMACILLAGFFTQASWKGYLTHTQVPIEWGLRPSMQQIMTAFDPRLANPRDSITLSNFSHQVIQPIITAVIFLAIALLTGVLWRDKRFRTYLFTSELILFLGMIAYLLGLLLLYLFSFTIGEGEGLASFSRYVGIFYIGWFLILLADIVIFSHQQIFCRINKTVEKTAGIFLVFLFIAGYFISNHHQSQLRQNIRKTAYFKSVISTITAPVKKTVQLKSTIYTVWQNSTGEARAMLVYNLVPRTPNLTGPTSLGAPYDKQDQWAVNLSDEEFLSILKNFDYLLLAHTDENFWQHYGKLFPAVPPELKPSSVYYICIRPGFNGVNKKGCVLTKQFSYLFKIEKNHGTIKLINMPGKEYN